MPTAFHVTAVPTFVGEDVEEIGFSKESTVQFGGVFKMFTVVVAVLCPNANRACWSASVAKNWVTRIAAATKTPSMRTETEILPRVLNKFIVSLIVPTIYAQKKGSYAQAVKVLSVSCLMPSGERCRGGARRAPPSRRPQHLKQRSEPYQRASETPPEGMRQETDANGFKGKTKKDEVCF